MEGCRAIAFLQATKWLTIDMSEIKIERLGGLAGFGLPNSRLSSVGRLSETQMTAADKDIVDALFSSQAQPAAPGAGDTFHYRITRRTATGSESIEVPEHQVPQTLIASVRDELL